MWDFIKTSLSVLALFTVLALVLGIYMSFIQGSDNDDEGFEQNQATTTQTSTSSDFIEVDSDQFIPEDTFDY